MQLPCLLDLPVNSVAQELNDRKQDCHVKNQGLAQQTLGGIRTIRSFKAEEDELRRYYEALEQMCAVKTRSGIYSSVFCLIRRVRRQWWTSVDETCGMQGYTLGNMWSFQVTVCMEVHFHLEKEIENVLSRGKSN